MGLPLHFEKRVCFIFLVFPAVYHSFLIALQVFIIRVSISIATYIGVINELNVSWYAYQQ